MKKKCFIQRANLGTYFIRFFLEQHRINEMKETMKNNIHNEEQTNDCNVRRLQTRF